MESEEYVPVVTEKRMLTAPHGKWLEPETPTLDSLT